MDPSVPPLPSPRLHTFDTTSFPIIAVAVIGILATAFLLVSYYVFVIKCCLNWHRMDILRRFSTSRSRNQDDPLMAYSPGRTSAARGLDESVIRSIPIFKFKKNGISNNNNNEKVPYNKDFGERSFCECAVCLNEFQEEERLRMIPNCGHVFHIDCIDVWLQNNGNCPLCRTSVSGSTPRLFPFDHIVAPSSSPQDPTGNVAHIPCASGGSFAGSGAADDDDDEYVVIELGDYTDRTLVAAQERLDPGELPSVAARLDINSPSTSRRKLERGGRHKNNRNRLNKAGSMGDECINIRGQDDEFAIQPIRRSFSMDSSADRQLFLAVQEIVQQRRQRIETAPLEGTSGGGGRSRRNFFSFGRGSRSSVLPVYFEPS